MDDKVSNLLAETAPKLKLKDIQLNKSKFEFPGKEDPRELKDVRRHNKKDIRYTLQDVELENGEKENTLYIFVDLGVMITGENEQQKRDTIFYIEAEYRVIYQVKEKIESPVAIEAFANFNGTHNVWPFWREHVFDIVSRARLPHIEVPLFTSADG